MLENKFHELESKIDQFSTKIITLKKQNSIIEAHNAKLKKESFELTQKNTLASKKLESLLSELKELEQSL